MSVVHRGGHLIVSLQSIVPEVDEEEEEKVVDTLSGVFPHPEESPKTFKRKQGLVELALVSHLVPFRYPAMPYRHTLSRMWRF